MSYLASKIIRLGDPKFWGSEVRLADFDRSLEGEREWLTVRGYVNADYFFKMELPLLCTGWTWLSSRIVTLFFAYPNLISGACTGVFAPNLK